MTDTATTARTDDGRTDEWRIDDLDLHAYLDRIATAAPDAPTAAALGDLHRAHVRTIPFENLDVALGRPVDLRLGPVQDKLVRRRRGGVCHEHNLLFAAALQTLGFTVRRILTRVRDNGRVVLPRGHSALLVDVAGQSYLADVGYGSEGILEPVPLRPGTVHHGAWRFDLDRRPDAWVLRAGDGGVLYSFADTPFRRPDFDVASYFLLTHPSSPFATGLVVQRVTPQARYALHGLTLTVIRFDGQQSHQTVAPDALRTVLTDTFGIPVDEAEAASLTAFLAEHPEPAPF